MTPKERHAQRMMDMSDVLKTEQGQRVIWEILDKSGFISPNPELDPALMNRNEGKREIGVDLYNWIMEAQPRRFLDMLQQRTEELEKINE